MSPEYTHNVEIPTGGNMMSDRQMPRVSQGITNAGLRFCIQSLCYCQLTGHQFSDICNLNLLICLVVSVDVKHHFLFNLLT